MIVINQRRQQPSKECALLMAELLGPGDRRLLKPQQGRLAEPAQLPCRLGAPAAFDAVLFTDPLPLKCGTELPQAAGHCHFSPSHAFWTLPDSSLTLHELQNHLQL